MKLNSMMSMLIHRRAGIVALLALAACGAPASQGEADPPGDGAAVASPSTASPPTAARRADPADTVLLTQALRRAAELPRLRGILVSQNGQVVLERYTGSAAADRPVRTSPAPW